MRDFDAALSAQEQEELMEELVLADEDGDFGRSTAARDSQKAFGSSGSVGSSTGGGAGSKRSQQQPSTVRWIHLDELPKDDEQFSGLQYYLGSLKLLAAICR
jgi:hypothetical protein